MKKDFASKFETSKFLIKDVMKEQKESIIIDDEFRDLIPPLTQEESEQLESNILSEGFSTPLIVWEGTNILIDGHNRYRIALKHKLETYKITYKSFGDRDTVKDWIITNQLGRRNLSPDQMSIFRGLLFNKIKDTKGGDRKSKGQNVTLIEGKIQTETQSEDTAKKLAKQFNVSDRTIKRDAKFVKDIELIDEVDPGFKKEMLSGKVKKSKKEISELAEGINKENNPEFENKKVKKEKEVDNRVGGKDISEFNPEEINLIDFTLSDINSYTKKELYSLLDLCLKEIKGSKK